MILNKLLPLFIGLSLLLAGVYCQAAPQKKVTLATVEFAPYIGEQLPNYGYVHELVTAVYKRIGYDVQIKFYPLARAKHLASRGVVDGYMPGHIEEKQQHNFTLSAPFPGDHIVFLKKKKLVIPNISAYAKDTRALLRSLSIYQFGVVRGTLISPIFDQAQYLKKQYVTNNLQNLDKLHKNRIDFVIGDKYSLADTMIAKRPHLIGTLEFLSAPFFSHPFHIAFSTKTENYKQLKEDFNLGLQLFIADGSLDKLLEKHGLFPTKDNSTNPIILTIGTVNNKDMLIMQELASEFEKSHPQIKLQWRTLTETTLRKRLLSDFAISDGQFDIMTIGSYETPLWAQRGWLTPLENLPEQYDKNDLLTTVRNALSYHHQLYALPFYAESSMLFYRKDLFDRHNLSMPVQPTYEDIIRFSAIIHAPDKGLYGICIRGKAGWGENIAVLTSIIEAYAGRWFSPKWQPMMDRSPWQQALATYIKLITRYGPPNAHLNGFNENLALFSKGHCGIWIDATVAAGLLFDAKQSKVYDKIAYTSAPIAKTAEGSHWLWAWALAIPSSSKHKKEALQFITWATSKSYIEKVAKTKGWIAVPPGTRKSTYKHHDYLNAAPFAQFVIDSIRSGKPLGSIEKTALYGQKLYESIPQFQSIGDYVGALLVKVIQGKISEQQALKMSQRFAEKIMESSGHYKKEQ
ncbi:MAG: extracellular solute-binding protein [Oceanospirillaceae bacterium]|nr:extracellular solute-binding protein [Oceanospirillaceae bacterium]